MSLLPILPAGFSVASVPFHRASPGMRRTFDAFLADDSKVRQDALQPFDYVAVCLMRGKLQGASSLYVALSAGRDWPGLIRVASDPGNPFQLFRIDHMALR
jgi:hypothetical protein